MMVLEEKIMLKKQFFALTILMFEINAVYLQKE